MTRADMAQADTAQRAYGLWDRLWIGVLDLFGVWLLIRRKRRVPQTVEVILAR
jgi:dolichol-phosphate mannosyltransferase